MVKVLLQRPMKLLNDFPMGYLSKPSLRLRKV